MKNKMALVVSLVLLLATTTSCGNTSDDDAKKKEKTTKITAEVEQDEDDEDDYQEEYDYEDDEYEDYDDYESDEPIYLEQKKLNHDIIIDYNVKSEGVTTILLEESGIVIAKGCNDEGQMGNGQRVDQGIWENITGLPTIKEIANHGMNFAISEDGDLYYWGRNHLEPEKYEFSEKFEQFDFELGKGLIKTIDGNYYYMHNCVGNGGLSDKDYSKYKDYMDLVAVDIPDGTTSVHFCNDDYFNEDIDRRESVWIIDGVLIKYNDFHRDNESFRTEASNLTTISSYCPVFDRENNRPTNEYGVKIYAITDAGSVYSIKEPLYGASLEEKDVGGSNYKKYDVYRYEVSDFWDEMAKHTGLDLFNNGILKASGSNEYGQIGDGTDIAYTDGTLQVDIPSVDDVWQCKTNVFAITQDNEIYAWGKNYGYYPSTIITSSDFTLY